MTGNAASSFIQRIRMGQDAATGRYPFTVAWLARNGDLTLPPEVTFLVGETVRASPR